MVGPPIRIEEGWFLLGVVEGCFILATPFQPNAHDFNQYDRKPNFCGNVLPANSGSCLGSIVFFFQKNNYWVHHGFRLSLPLFHAHPST